MDGDRVFLISDRWIVEVDENGKVPRRVKLGQGELGFVAAQPGEEAIDRGGSRVPAWPGFSLVSVAEGALDHHTVVDDGFVVAVAGGALPCR